MKHWVIRKQLGENCNVPQNQYLNWLYGFYYLWRSLDFESRILWIPATTVTSTVLHEGLYEDPVKEVKDGFILYLVSTEMNGEIPHHQNQSASLLWQWLLLLLLLLQLLLLIIVWFLGKQCLLIWWEHIFDLEPSLRYLESVKVITNALSVKFY